MASNEDLVPRDQPYGARQRNVQLMRQAGLPLSSSSVPSPFEGLDVAAQPLRRARPDYDALLETAPPVSAPPGVVSPSVPFSVTERFLERARSSANSFDRAVAVRLAALRGD